MEEASTVEKEPNLETRAFLYEELERTRIHCESVVNENCAKMSIQGNVMSEDELQAYADIRGAPVKVCVLILMHTFWFTHDMVCRVLQKYLM